MFPGGKGGRSVGLTTLPPSSGDCLEIWEPQTPGTSQPVQACNGIALPLESQFRIQDSKYVYSIHGSRNSTYNMLRKTQV